jgi:electron transfer flavoprotein alpha/beta subunit
MTNAKSNRLRYPLMKNVMAAKREPAVLSPLAASQQLRTRRAVSVTAVIAKARHDAPCRMVSGTEDEQARAVADFLGRLLNAEV